MADGSTLNIPGPFGIPTPFTIPNPLVPQQSTGSTAPSDSVANHGGTEPMLPAALKWIGALFLLWVILTALTEHGDPNAKNIGRALTGLILLGALYYLGPGAISNASKLV